MRLADLLDDQLPLRCKVGRHDLVEGLYERSCRRCPARWRIDSEKVRHYVHGVPIVQRVVVWRRSR